MKASMCYLLAYLSYVFAAAQLSWLMWHSIRPLEDPISALTGATMLAARTFFWLGRILNE